jgi:predicted negative regulator of RcsB-dependent stress response
MDDETINKNNFNFKQFLKQNKLKLISIIGLGIIFVIIFVFFDEYKKRQNIHISEKYNKAKILIEKNEPQEALILLEEIISRNNIFYSPSALNLIIDKDLIKNRNKIIEYFDKVISDSGLDSETKNLFIFKKIIYLGDNISENELLKSLKPIIQSNSLWKDTVSDYIKKYYLSKGEFNKAKEFEKSKN